MARPRRQRERLYPAMGDRRASQQGDPKDSSQNHRSRPVRRGGSCAAVSMVAEVTPRPSRNHNTPPVEHGYAGGGSLAPTTCSVGWRWEAPAERSAIVPQFLCLPDRPAIHRLCLICARKSDTKRLHGGAARRPKVTRPGRSWARLDDPLNPIGCAGWNYSAGSRMRARLNQMYLNPLRPTLRCCLGP